MTSQPKLVFVAEWQEPYGTIPRKFILTYYSSDSTVEMFDIKSRRPFLRRTPCNNIEISNLHVGSKISVMSRLLTLTEYGDAATRDKVNLQMERSLAMVKAEGFTKLGFIFDAVHQCDLEVRNMKMFDLTPSIQKTLLKPSEFSIFLSSGKLLATELKGVRSAQKWNDIRSDLNIAEMTYGSSDKESAEMEIQTIFLDKPIWCNTAKFEDSTCCLVKPHAIRDGNLSQIVQRILDANLSITAMDMIQLDMVRAEEFFEVYRGIVPDYQRTLEEMTSGSTLAMEITGPKAHKRFREMVGPHDPELAKLLKPGTIRAEFGKDRVKNVVHCTDMPEDASLEGLTSHH